MISGSAPLPDPILQTWEKLTGEANGILCFVGLCLLVFVLFTHARFKFLTVLQFAFEDILIRYKTFFLIFGKE